jgi:hypothetical protein
LPLDAENGQVQARRVITDEKQFSGNCAAPRKQLSGSLCKKVRTDPSQVGRKLNETPNQRVSLKVISTAGAA